MDQLYFVTHGQHSFRVYSQGAALEVYTACNEYGLPYSGRKATAYLYLEGSWLLNLVPPTVTCYR